MKILKMKNKRNAQILAIGLGYKLPWKEYLLYLATSAEDKNIHELI